MMKTRWIGSVALVFSLLAAITLVQAPDGPTAFAQQAAQYRAVPDPEADAEPKSDSEPKAIHICPIVPIEVYGGASLYEALYYPDDTCTSPTLTYAYGNFTYPQTCPNCGAYKDKSLQPYYGLATPVPANYRHMLPAGRPYKYSKKAPTPDDISYLYLERKGVYVKVFSFLINRTDMTSGATPDPANYRETIHVAFECSDPATVGVDVADIDEVHQSKQRPIADAGGAPTTVYDVTYDHAGGQAHILTFLCGDPEPPVDQPKPATAQ